jgi:hypothetical protein
LSQLRDVFFDYPFVMLHCELIDLSDKPTSTTGE